MHFFFLVNFSNFLNFEDTAVMWFFGVAEFESGAKTWLASFLGSPADFLHEILA